MSADIVGGDRNEGWYDRVDEGEINNDVECGD